MYLGHFLTQWMMLSPTNRLPGVCGSPASPMKDLMCSFLTLKVRTQRKEATMKPLVVTVRCGVYMPSQVLERRVGTFCLAVSHVILLNLNCKDVGRKDASGWPLFEKLVRAYVGLPEVCRVTPKPTLIAVLRDCNRKAAVDELKNTVIQRLKTVVQKVAAELRWSDVFNVTVGCLAHYEYEQDQFRVDCSSLSTLIAGCIREPLVTLIEFRDRASDTWEEIWYDPDIRACRQQLIAKRMSNLRRPIQKKISLTQPDNLFETTRQTPCQLYLTEALDAFAEQSRGLDKDELATQLRLYMQP
eukprot:Blabericola_migrator_1__4807@NODE_2524_length_2646_cov_44_776658_g1578_i0_p1_GENE_NODE_2524_length_2646_cov_44_776658_g1578_i0NODE_2524_length_2646_cov_44_776658_g1578_i0_p1_ORF_typecomplete_len300_score49_17RHD3/PF05879_12/1_7e14_NODE_2524_length_2646_cov_44_776658_g1578_i01941093